jgi:hypothetical protein
MRFLIRALIFVVIGLVLGLGGWFIFDNATGKRQWMAWKAKRTAMGDHFEWRELEPDPVPDDENFAMAPLVAGAMKDKDLIDPRLKALAPPPFTKQSGDGQKGTTEYLQAYARSCGKPSAMEALDPLEAALEELAEASRRPACRLPVHYGKGEYPGISVAGFLGAAQALQLRALAHLQADHPDRALEDILTNLRMAHHLRNEPHLIPCAIHTGILAITRRPIREGLRDHQWSDPQLQILEAELARVDLLKSTRRALEGERLSYLNHLESLAEGRAEATDTQEPRPRPGFFKRNWIYRNMLEYDRATTRDFIDIIQPAKHRIHVPISRNQLKRDQTRRKDQLLAQLGTHPLFLKTISDAALIQSHIDQMRIVCGLERHRQTRGSYPSSLQDMASSLNGLLPHDLINAEPLRYARRSNGFLLYSVGWDGQDDGGAEAVSPGQTSGIDFPKGDWSWLPSPVAP